MSRSHWSLSRWVAHRPRPSSKWYRSSLCSFKIIKFFYFEKYGNGYLIPKLVILNLSVHYEPLTEITLKNVSNFYCFNLNVFVLCHLGYDSRILWNFFFTYSDKERYPLAVHSSVWSQGTECLVTLSFLLSSPGHSPNLLHNDCQITPYPLLVVFGTLWSN